jgi:BioD-like phosphotransacetylase family protein
LVAVYVTSSAGGTGKTSIVAGIARRLVTMGIKVGYLNPSVTAARVGADTGAAVLQHFLGLPENPDELAPAFADENALRSGIKDAVSRVSSGKDVVIVEGPAGGVRLAAEVASILGATVLGVESFAADPAALVAHYQGMGSHLAGVVVNKVPRKRVAQVQAAFASRLGGVKLAGVVPEERSAAALSVAELAADVRGTIVSGVDGATVTIESIMLAAMNPDHGPEYYALREKKAVIVRSERPDMQLAALETPTACLVLAGPKPPIQMVLRRAEASHVPIISTKDGVAAAVAGIEAGLREARLTDGRVAAVAAVVDRSLDFGTLFRDLGLTVRT